MDKSGDYSDGSITWEEFFGSSTDLVPTLLNIYDTIARNLSNDQEEGNSTHAAENFAHGTSTNDSNSTNLRSGTLRSKRSGNNISSCSRTDMMEEINKNTSCAINTTNANNNSPGKTMSSSRNSSSSNSVNHRFGGVLSRNFPRWSSTKEMKSKQGASVGERNGLTQSNAKGQPPPLQRPLSISSTLSSTSSSSASSESSMSLSNGAERIAPRASPEEEDLMIIPDADLSEDENYSCAKITDDQTKRTERCFANSSITKDAGENGRRSRIISYPIQTQGNKPKLHCDSNLSYMDHVVAEILETERVYVNDLSEIISGYLRYWRLHPEDSPPADDVKELFSNIEEIHEFNDELLTQLECCGLNPVQVAGCFVTKNEGFSIYSSYCTNYPRTMGLLTDMNQHEELVKCFRERQASLGHTLPLGSYLLKPVQRILKYHLMLGNIAKHYDHETDGYETIVKALSAMTNNAHHINDMKRRHEHEIRVQEIQSLLYGWEGEDLTTYGELCAEGTFRVCGAKAQRHVFLFDKMVLLTKKKEDGILSYKSHILADRLMLIESIAGEPLSFQIIPYDSIHNQCILVARNMDQKREWTLQIKRMILENYGIDIPPHAQELVMNLGQCRQEGTPTAREKVQTKRQHSAPEYLERRKQEKGRKTESSLKAKLRRARKCDPISPKESPAAAARSRNRRTSVDNARDRSESTDREVGIDRKMSSASCPPSVEITEKRLVKKLSGWRRKSEPGYYLNNGVKSWKENGLGPRPQCPTLLAALASDESIGEERGETEHSETDLFIEDIDEPEDVKKVPNVEERRESVEEIVGQLVMQNHDFQRILSKQRLVHLRKALAQHQQRQLHEEDESASETETEESPIRSSRGPMGLELKKPGCGGGSQTSSSNGIGSSSDMHELSTENVACDIEPGDDCILASKNVQRTVSDPGNKATLTPRRFISGPFAHYDPLSLLWSSFRRTDNHRKEVNGEIKSTREKSTNIRHTHSFTCSRKESIPSPNTELLQMPKESLPHGGDSGVFPNSFTSDSSSSSEANIPTLPAVWLKQQAGHLATPNNKSGSLPRSFQVSPPSNVIPTTTTESNGGNSGVKSRLRDGRYADRPFTIASDKPSPTDMSLDEMEQHMSKFNDENNPGNSPLAPGEDFDDLTTPVMQSMENVSLHPDHKIYRSSKSSIKHLLLTVTQRLAGLKVNMRSSAAGSNSTRSIPPTDTLGSHQNITTENVQKMDECRKSLKQKMKLVLNNEDRDSDGENCSESVACSSGSSGFGSLGSCGSSTNNLATTAKKIGARLAQCEQPDDYALSKLLGSALNDSLNRRPHSVMSTSSTNTTSSSSTDEKFGESPQVGCCRGGGRKSINHRDLYLSYIDQDAETLSDSDASADSFYERSFEAIENLLENELFPDSAIYSDDPDESLLASPNSPGSRTINWTMANFVAAADPSDELVESTTDDHLPQPPPASKPPLSPESRRTRSRLVRSQAILEKLKHLEQCSTHFRRGDLPSPSFEGIKSIRERRKELDLWKMGGAAGNRGEDESETSSQHSTSTINTVIEMSPTKSTSFPSSRRCSDTESSASGGNSPLTERAVSRSSGRSQSHGHLGDPMPKGWVKLVVGKLEAET